MVGLQDTKKRFQIGWCGKWSPLLLLYLPAEGASLLSPFFALQTDSTVERHARHDGLTRAKDGRRIWKNCHSTLCRDTLLESVQSATKLHLVAKLSSHLMVCPFCLYETHCCMLLEGVGSARHQRPRCAMSTSPCPLLRNVLVPAQSQATTTRTRLARGKVNGAAVAIDTNPPYRATQRKQQNSTAACIGVVRIATAATGSEMNHDVKSVRRLQQRHLIMESLFLRLP